MFKQVVEWVIELIHQWERNAMLPPLEWFLWLLHLWLLHTELGVASGQFVLVNGA